MELNIPESAVCLDCGYALRGLHDAICPECGRAFDPANARTFRWRPSVIKRWRELAEPPAGWHIYGVIVVTLLTLYQTSEPPGPRYLLELIPIGCIAGCFGPIFGLAISIDYVVRIIAIKSDRSRSAQDLGMRSRRRNRRFVVAPLCIVLIISMFVTAWPIRARFHFSRTAFESVAKQCLASGESISKDQWLGLYHVDRVQVNSGRVYFKTGGFWDPVGFVVDSVPAEPDHTIIQKIAPNWYTYEAFIDGD